MPPLDPESIGKGVVDGVLLKLGDVILMHAPGMVKKGVAVVIVVFTKRLTKKTGGKTNVQIKKVPDDKRRGK